MDNWEESSDESVGSDWTDDYDSLEEEEDEYPEDKYQSYSFEYVEHNYPNACLLRRRNKKIRPQKAAAVTARRERRRKNFLEARLRKKDQKKCEDEDPNDWTEDEDYKSDGSCDELRGGPPLLRVVPTLQGIEVMDKLHKWEAKNRLKVLKKGGAEIKSTSCAQADRPARMGPKFKTPGPWLQCATQHYTTSNCYGKKRRVERRPKVKVPLKPPFKKPSPIRGIIGRRYPRGSAQAKEECKKCSLCCYWNFEHYDDTEMYYKNYVDTVTFVREAMPEDPDGSDKKNDEAIYGRFRDRSEVSRSPSDASLFDDPAPGDPTKGKYAEIKSRYLLPKVPPKGSEGDSAPTNSRLPPIQAGTSYISDVPTLPVLPPPRGRKKTLEELGIKFAEFSKRHDLDRLTLPKIMIQGSRGRSSTPSKLPHPSAVPRQRVENSKFVSFPSLGKNPSQVSSPPEMKPRRWISPTIKKKTKGDRETNQMPKPSTSVQYKKPSNLDKKKKKKGTSTVDTSKEPTGVNKKKKKKKAKNEPVTLDSNKNKKKVKKPRKKANTSHQKPLRADKVSRKK